MGLPCDELREALIRYKQQGEYGAFAELSRLTGVSQQVLSRTARGQKTIEYENWKKLHDFDPAFFPPPRAGTVQESRFSFSDKSAGAFPELIEIITRNMNESAAKGWSKISLLEMLIRQLEIELIKEKQNGQTFLRRTA